MLGSNYLGVPIQNGVHKLFTLFSVCHNSLLSPHLLDKCPAPGKAVVGLLNGWLGVVEHKISVYMLHSYDQL